MCKLQNSTGFSGFGETSWETGDVAISAAGKAYVDNLISKSNLAPILDILNIYKIKLKNGNKLTCPFPAHSNGKESTPSFVVYPKTNTFWCYGCGTGSAPVDFVANMESISVVNAAKKIICLFEGKDVIDIERDTESYSVKFGLYLDFSNIVYNFIQNNRNDDAIKYIEKITFIFDSLCATDDFSNEALESLIFKLNDLALRF